MKTTIFATLSAALLILASPSAIVADDDAAVKPHTVISFAGVQEIRDDIKFLGSLSGRQHWANVAEDIWAAFSSGGAGIDDDRPWGAIAVSDPAKWTGFVPVDDFDAFIAGYERSRGEPEDAGDEIFKLKFDNLTLFVTSRNGWAFFAESKDDLADVPNDPIKLLDGLNVKYDLALRSYMQRAPESVKSNLITETAGGTILQLQREAGESDEQFQFRNREMRTKMESDLAFFKEFDQITVGFAIDRAAKRIIIENPTTALPNSLAIEKMFRVADTRSQFAGFLAPDAILTLHTNVALTDVYTSPLISSIKTWAHQLEDDLKEDQRLDEPARAAVAEILHRVVDEMIQVLEGGNINVALAVTGESPVSIVGGALLTDGNGLEESVKTAAKILSDAPRRPNVQLNVAEHAGIRFHTAVAPFPDDDGGVFHILQGLYGEKVNVTIGIGKQAAYIALGPDGITQLKTAIDASRQAPDQRFPAAQAAFDLQKYSRLNAKMSPEMHAAFSAFTELLEGDGNNQITLETEEIPNGTNVRLIFEEGILKLFGPYVDLMFGIARGVPPQS